MVKNYFKIAFRNLTRNKTYAIINILGLTLGIISCITIYLVTSFEFGFDKFHPDKERIYRLVSELTSPSGERQQLSMVPDPSTETIRQEFTGIEMIAAFHLLYSGAVIKNGNEIKKFDSPVEGRDIPDVILAEPQYFGIFKYEWILGTPSVLNEPFQVVLTESKAHKYFSLLTNEEIIGKEVIYNDSLRFTVGGIVKDFEKSSDFNFKDFLSYSTAKQKVFRNEFSLDNWLNWSGSSQFFVKFQKGTIPEKINAQLASLCARKIKFDSGDKAIFGLQPLSDVHFNTNYHDDYIRKAHLPTLYGLMGIAAFILIIAAINFINLSTAQSTRRAKEIGVRKVLGSDRKKLIFQFLSETFLLTSIAVILALCLVPLIISSFRNYIPEGITLDIVEPRTIIFLTVILVATSLLAGFYPARILSSYLPALSLKGEAPEKVNSKGYLRKSLIIFQFTISVVFIISTLVIGQQMHYIYNKDMGFNKDAIINLSPSWSYGGQKARVFAEKIKPITGVKMVSVDLGTPAEKGHWGTRMACDETNVKELEATLLGGDENYLPLYHIKLIAGRNLQNSDTVREYLVNETCMKQLGFKKPEDILGKIIHTGMSDATANNKCPVVGVMSDFHTNSLHEPIKPAFMISSKTFCRRLSVKLDTKGRTGHDFQATIDKIEKEWKDIYPNAKFEYSFFDETIARFYEKEKRTSGIMNLAMSIAIFISCMGLFGLAAFTIRQRTKEIGIRKVLGASVTGIISLLSRDFLKPVLIALAIAVPIAWYFMHKWLQDFAFRISIGWWVFIAAGALAIIIAFITVGFQAMKAAIANPVKSLRTE